MMNTKTLMLAAVTALTLSAGVAMAQEIGPSFAPETSSIPSLSANPSAARAQSQGQGVQFGGSDLMHGDNQSMRAFDQYNSYAGGN